MSCDLCGGSAFTPVLEGCEDVIARVPGPMFDVLRCDGCGLVRTEPRPDPDEMGRWYGVTYAAWTPGGAAGGGRRALRAVLEAPYRFRWGAGEHSVPPPPRPGARAAEVGSGGGARLRDLTERGWEAWGVEPFAPEGDAAGGARVVRARAEDADLPEDAFDQVAFRHSLEHTHDPLAALSAARRWLRQDGRLVVSAPNFDSRERRVFGRYWNGLDVPRHLNHFSPSTLRLALGKAGFEVHSVRPQLQGSSFGGSLQHLAEQRGRRRPYRPRGPLYSLGAGIGTLLCAGGGNGAFIEVVARPRG